MRISASYFFPTLLMGNQDDNLREGNTDKNGNKKPVWADGVGQNAEPKVEPKEK
jgi:hypothetical protein